MGFLRGPGSLQFKWGLTKALFPELTKTYYKNTGRGRGGSHRRGEAGSVTTEAVTVYPDCDTTPPTAEERDWMNSFAVFIERVNSLKNDRSAAGHKQLFLLLCSAGGVQKQHSKFFDEQRHTKDFLDAYIRFGKKVLELSKLVDKHITRDERARIVEQTKGQIAIDTNTWQEIGANNIKR